MNQLESEIQGWLDDAGAVPEAGRVMQLMEQYPYFALPAALAVNRGGDAIDGEMKSRMCRHVALNTPDHEALRSLLDGDDAEFAGFYPQDEKDPTPSTTDAIDKFISTYGKTDPNEEAVLMRMIFNPTPDYAQVLAAQEQRSAPVPGEAPEGSHEQLINDFIIKTRSGNTHDEDVVEPAVTAEPEERPQQPTPGAEESMLSESLAKIYIGQRRYAKAFEIISNLNLKFPEKSIYFADQMRFLQKLMLAQKFANQTGNDN